MRTWSDLRLIGALCCAAACSTSKPSAQYVELGHDRAGTAGSGTGGSTAPGSGGSGDEGGTFSTGGTGGVQSPEPDPVASSCAVLNDSRGTYPIQNGSQTECPMGTYWRLFPSCDGSCQVAGCLLTCCTDEDCAREIDRSSIKPPRRSFIGDPPQTRCTGTGASGSTCDLKTNTCNPERVQPPVAYTFACQ